MNLQNMKANKNYYDTLRQDVDNGSLHSSPGFLVQRRPTSVVNPDATSQASASEAANPQDNLVQELNDKIAGLEAQVESLEQRNLELTQQNKQMEAQLEYLHSPSIVTDSRSLEPNPEIDREEERIMGQILHEEYVKAEAKKYGYISIEAIARWANEGTTSINEARLIKDMIHDTAPYMPDNCRELVSRIGTPFREPNVAIPHHNTNNYFGQGSNNVVAMHDINNSRMQ